jgi:hypothetical protein
MKRPAAGITLLPTGPSVGDSGGLIAPAATESSKNASEKLVLGYLLRGFVPHFSAKNRIKSIA